MTMLTSGLTSSNTDQWATPQYLFDILDREFHFTLDVCADETNHKCERYFTKEQDGLLQKWEGVCWMNPPYGKTIGRWMEKARLSARGGAVVVCLIPARTDTRWWVENVCEASECRFIAGRVKFGDADVGAPFPSVIVVFGTPRQPTMSIVHYDEIRDRPGLVSLDGYRRP